MSASTVDISRRRFVIGSASVGAGILVGLRVPFGSDSALAST